jgi:hypothetical protein
MTARRWVCPKCNEGVLAPARPRRDDVRRYCLSCSARTGRLVVRICPARELARANAEAQHKAAVEARKAKRAAERAAARAERVGAEAAAREVRSQLRAMPITEIARLRTREAYVEAAQRYAKLRAWERDLSDCDVTWRFTNTERGNTSTNGLAHPSARGPGRFMVNIGTDIADAHTTIIHELAHIAAGPKNGHDARWRGLFQLAVSEVVGHHVDVPATADRHAIHTILERALALYLYGGGAS